MARVWKKAKANIERHLKFPFKSPKSIVWFMSNAINDYIEREGEIIILIEYQT